MLVVLVCILSSTFFMSDNVSTSTAVAEIDRATTIRVRRPERSAAAEQPPVKHSAKRSANQAWRTFGFVEAPAGGKNPARREQKLGPFQAPTQEAAQQLRDQAVDDFLHKPVRQKKDKAVGSSSSSMEQAEIEPRPTRAASQIQPGVYKPTNICGGSVAGQRGAGPGCARPHLARGTGLCSARACAVHAIPHARSTRQSFHPCRTLWQARPHEARGGEAPRAPRAAVARAPRAATGESCAGDRGRARR